MQREQKKTGAATDKPTPIRDTERSTALECCGCPACTCGCNGVSSAKSQ
jgi:hypothetical protein